MNVLADVAVVDEAVPLLPSSPRLIPRLLDNDATIFVVVVVGPCRQDRGGGEEATTPADTPATAHGGKGLRKSKSSATAAPTATSTSTGLHVMGRPACEDDVKVGVPLMTTMMTMAAATTTVEVPPTCPMGSGTSSRPPSKGTRQNSAPKGSRRPLRWDWDRLGVGGVGTPTTWPDDHRDPDGEKIEEGIEGGDDGRFNFERASYVARIAPPMLPRGRRKKGWIDAGRPHRRADDDDCPRAWIDAGPPLSSYVALLGRVSPSGIVVRMLPSSDEFHNMGSAFFRAGGGGGGR